MYGSNGSICTYFFCIRLEFTLHQPANSPVFSPVFDYSCAFVQTSMVLHGLEYGYQIIC
ncbi:hypothetical protein Hanom_Chr11g01052011 [Helianthus anomalus]